MGDEWHQAAGGAVNILLGAARSGAVCVHAGAIGTGPNGDLIRASLAAEDVTWAGDPIPEADTALCIVLVEPSGERTFITMQGAERRLSRATLEAAAPVEGDLVCVTGYSLAVESTCAPLLAFLESLPAGVEVVLDPGAVFAGLTSDLVTRTLAVTTVWTSNLEEAQALAGGVDMASAARLVANLLPPSAVVIVRDGPAGCVVWVAGEVHRVPGHPQLPVDTNGAGDAHTGVLLAERAEGVAWIRAAERANIAGAITVMRQGPATCPTRAEIDAFEARVAARLRA